MLLDKFHFVFDPFKYKYVDLFLLTNFTIFAEIFGFGSSLSSAKRHENIFLLFP